MDLNEIAQEMLTEAVNAPVNWDTAPGVGSHKRTIDYRDTSYEVSLSFGIRENTKESRGWHLSVSHDLPVPDDVAFEFANAFLGEEFDELAFPPVLLANLEPSVREHLASGRQRQFWRCA